MSLGQQPCTSRCVETACTTWRQNAGTHRSRLQKQWAQGGAHANLTMTVVDLPPAGVTSGTPATVGRWPKHTWQNENTNQTHTWLQCDVIPDLGSTIAVLKSIDDQGVDLQSDVSIEIIEHVVACETVTKHQVVQQVIRCHKARNPRKFSCIWDHLGIHAEFRKKSTGYNEANRWSKSGTTCPLFPLTEWSALAENQLHSLLNAFRWGVSEQDLNQSTHPSCHFHCSYI